MDDDAPNTQTEPRPTMAVVIPSQWDNTIDECVDCLMIQRGPVLVVDFYPEETP